MKGVILDRNSFDRSDVDFHSLDTLDVTWSSHAGTRAAQTLERISGCDIVVTNKVVLDGEILDRAPTLKLVLIAATGTDNVDLDQCRKQGITVCNVKHYATPAVAQHTITLMLNLLTSQPLYQADVRSGAWSRSEVFCLLDHPIVEIAGKRLAIVGFGVLGRRVAELAEALGMHVDICQRPGGPPQDNRMPLSQLLPVCDVLSLHCPLTSDTHHLLGADEFAMMKSSAIVINTARGAIIDSHALIAALRDGAIAGAGIDVLDQEPPDPDHALLQSDIPNLILTPHNAWASRESRQRLVEQLAENLSQWQTGSPVNVVT